jgi:hypothetical protein
MARGQTTKASPLPFPYTAEARKTTTKCAFLTPFQVQALNAIAFTLYSFSATGSGKTLQ